MAKIADAAEGGTNGVFRFTRTGDTSGSLTVDVAVTGTAGGGDYDPMSGVVVFQAGSATSDALVLATADAVYDPDETVIITIQAGSGYTVGTQNTATVTISDDINAVTTLIHQQTFTLTGAGAAGVTLTVTYNAPGAAGLYTWNYAVENTGGTELASFSVPFSGTGTDVANPTSSNGWLGTIDGDSVDWAADPGQNLLPGQTATFTFVTAPREVGPATVSAGVAGGGAAQLPTAPAPRPVVVAGSPRVNITFPTGSNQYTLRLTMRAADGGTYSSGPMLIATNSPSTARDFIYDFLKDSGWAVAKAGDTGLIIKGKVQADATIAAPKSLTYWVTDVQGLSGVPAFTKAGQVDLTEGS